MTSLYNTHIAIVACQDKKLIMCLSLDKSAVSRKYGLSGQFLINKKLCRNIFKQK